MSQDNHQLALRWFEQVWNQGNEAAVDELAAPEAQCFGFPQPESVLNREEFKAYLREFRTSFSAIHVTVDETVCEDDRVAIRWTGTMRHTGPGLGFAPTGHFVTTIGMSLFHLDNGRILIGWNAVDLGSAIAHLSAVSARP